VKAYHGALQELNIASRRNLTQDLELTSALVRYGN
jgi:hypothetical protein